MEDAGFDAISFVRDARRQPRRATVRPSGMDALVALQAADGSWDLSAELALIIGRSLSEIEAALVGASGAMTAVRRAWATALALAWLQVHAAGLEDEWRLLGTKARKWIDDVAACRPAAGPGSTRPNDFWRREHERAGGAHAHAADASGA